jgi:pSer/pThr/pTyr-binding forkhead associated (FHA) protein
MLLEVLIADTAVNEIPLDRTALTIGRSAENDVVLDDPLVSAHHARIEIDTPDGSQPVLTIEDLGSTNGTRVNGKDIHKYRLKPNDVIQIGRSAMRVVADR